MRMQGLVLKALCSTLLLLALVTTAYSQSDCSQAESCDLCVGNSIPTLAGCVWRVCPNDNNLGVCMTDEGNSNDSSMNCSWTRVSELCTAVETVAEGGSEDCSQAESCDLCVGGSIVTETGCVWRVCPNDNGIGVCKTDEGNSNDSSMNCSWTRVAELCTAVEIVAEAGSEDDGKPKSDFSQARFDMSSFIGGIILVLCLQAGGFFAMRFLKTKEQSTYDPIEQPQ